MNITNLLTQLIHHTINIAFGWFETGLSILLFSKKTCKIRGTLIQHIKPQNSPDAEPEIGFICSIRIFNISEVITNTTKCLNLVLR